MSPDEAIQILDNATSHVSGTRLDHIRIQTALSTLREAFKPKAVVPPTSANLPDILMVKKGGGPNSGGSVSGAPVGNGAN